MAINITSRVRNAMVGLTLGLCIFFTIVIFLLVYVIEDQVFINQVKVEQTAFERLIAEGNHQEIKNWRPANTNIKRIEAMDDLPGSLPDKVLKRIKTEVGVHEYFDDNRAMFIAKLVSKSDNSHYYLVYNVKDLLVVRDSKRVLLALIIGLTLIIAIVSIMLARRLTQSTLAPVSRLSQALQKDDLDHVVIDLASEFSEDEIGVLARELAQSLERVRDSSQREYEFNRGVSHELRSPIQVAQSATELLQLYADKHDTNIGKPISRLTRAISEMSEIAEAFLWLTSERDLEQNEMCSLNTLHEILTEVQSVFSTHEIIIDFQASMSFQYPMPRSALSVVLRNLLRNAVIHGEHSPIFVDIHDDKISISNSIREDAGDAKGFGVGLSIVKRICDRFDCQLITQARNDGQYSCSLRFN